MKTLMILAGVVLLVAVAYVQEVSYGPTAGGGGSVATLTDVSFGTVEPGDVFYRNATHWTNLAKGTDGQVLKLASGLPTWAADATAAGGETEGTVHAPDGATTANRIALFKDTTGTNITQAAVGISDLQPADADLTTWAGITPGANVGTFLATPSSANFASAITDETGSGGVVLSNAPTIFNATLSGALQGNLAMGDNDITGIGSLTADEFNVTTLNVTGLIDGAKLTNTVYVAAGVVQVDDDAYAAGWNGSTNVPTKNAVYDQMELRAPKASPTFTGTAIIPAANTGTLTVNDDAYAAGWDGSTNVPSKNALYDKIELLSTKADPTFTGTATAPTAAIATLTLGSGTVTNNIGAVMAAPAANAVIDMNFASRIVTLDGALTLTHVTNAVASREMTHTLYLRAGGANRALTIPSTWQTNAFSPKPANITNGWLTKIYITTIGATGDSASQTNAMVSFEYYKVP